MADTPPPSVFAVLWSTIRELLDSKKFVALFSASIVALVVKLAARQGYVLDADTAREVVQIVMGSAGAYAVSQGVADVGKERKP